MFADSQNVTEDEVVKAWLERTYSSPDKRKGYMEKERVMLYVKLMLLFK